MAARSSACLSGSNRATVLATTGATLALTVVSGYAAAAQPSSGSQDVTPPLVGRWSRVTTCQEYVAALRNAGLGPSPRPCWRSDGRVGDSRAIFHYGIDGGDRLTSRPVISATSKRQALAHPLEFSTAGWMVKVALPAHAWARVPCNRWC